MKISLLDGLLCPIFIFLAGYSHQSMGIGGYASCILQVEKGIFIPALLPSPILLFS